MRAVPDFWDNAEIRKALLTLVSHPGIPRSEERAQIVAHFDAVLPERRNRERVDRAISYLLRLVAEEVWSVPGAREIREIAALQMQRLSTEATQQQVAILKAQMQATTQLSTDVRQALLQLTETVEQRLLLPAPEMTLPPPSPRPWHNLPQLYAVCRPQGGVGEVATAAPPDEPHLSGDAGWHRQCGQECIGA